MVPYKINVTNIIIMTTGIECDQCSATFTLKSSLMKHIKQVHNKIRYPCEECEKSYTSKQNLLYHIQSVHLKVKHYCNFCTSVFKLKAGLKHHLQSKHTSFITPSIWIWFSNAVDVNQTSMKRKICNSICKFGMDLKNINVINVIFILMIVAM